MRKILHIDMDAFFAAVEQKRHPELLGKPVVIGGAGDPMQRGVVSTASYEARTFGIHSAMPLQRAYNLCPQAVFLPVDYAEYKRVSLQVKEILMEYSPVMEDVGIDEAYLDVTDEERPPEEIAREIKKRVKEGLGITCSIGIGPNKLLAKTASDMQKPDGLTVITREDVPRLFHPLDVRKLMGVGPKMEGYLKEMGIETIGQLASVPKKVLVYRFGASYGNYLYDASRGIDESPLIMEWEPKSISREQTFQRDVVKWQVIAKTLADLTKDVVEDMKEKDYLGRTVTVKLRYDDFETITRGKTLPEPTDDEETLRKAVFGCLKRIELSRAVRLLGVRVTNLTKPDLPE
ncbi:MAG: DNA polymerase IV [Smithellaceae bacterium]|nr:DNA polymerase IV [Smithellaceae bacterium]